MIITAKFHSVCPDRGEDIEIGKKVSWHVGAPASHVACAELLSKEIATAYIEFGGKQKKRDYGSVPSSDDRVKRLAKWHERNDAKVNR